MRVARLHGIGDIRVDEEPSPDDVPAGHSLVRVSAVGLCGSDLHWFGEGGIGDSALDRPLVLGHEFAGVVELGPLRGTRVAIDPALPCEQCASCLDGDPNLCPRVRFAGHGEQDGALRELLPWPDHRLHPIPDDLSDAGGAMLEPLGVALHAFDLGHVKVGSTVAIVGCGPIGLLLVQVARAAGATQILAVEPLAHRRRAAQAMGADLAVGPEDVDDGVPGRGVDIAFEIAGTDGAVDAALYAARPGARVVLAGIPDHDRTSFRASIARRKGLTLLLARRMRHVYPRAIAMVRRGLIDVESVVSQRYELAEAARAFAAAATRDGLKTVIEIRAQPGAPRGLPAVPRSGPE